MKKTKSFREEQSAETSCSDIITYTQQDSRLFLTCSETANQYPPPKTDRISRKQFPALEGFKKGFHEFGKIITNIVNTILLVLIYFIGVGTAHLFTKITKQRLIDFEKKDVKTYYNEKIIEKENIEEYYKQF